MSGPSGKDIFCHIKYQEHLAVLQYICWLPSGLLQDLPAGGKRMPFQGCLSFYFSITILKRLRLHRDTYSSTPTYVGQNHTKNLLLPKLLIEQFSGFWVHFTSVSPLGWNVLTVLQRLDVTPISSSCLLFWALKPYWGTGHSTYLRLILVPWFLPKFEFMWCIWGGIWKQKEEVQEEERTTKVLWVFTGLLLIQYC